MDRDQPPTSGQVCRDARMGNGLGTRDDQRRLFLNQVFQEELKSAEAGTHVCEVVCVCVCDEGLHLNI